MTGLRPNANEIERRAAATVTPNSVNKPKNPESKYTEVAIKDEYGHGILNGMRGFALAAAQVVTQKPKKKRKRRRKKTTEAADPQPDSTQKEASHNISVDV